MTALPRYQKTVAVVPMHRSGTYLIGGVLHELGLPIFLGETLAVTFTVEGGALSLTKTGRDFFRAFLDVDRFIAQVVPVAPIGVRMSHVFQPTDFEAPLLRPVRDPRDVVIAAARAQSKPAGRPTLTAEALMDTPFAPWLGGYFRLGMIEEWFLANRMISHRHPDGLHIIRMEDLKRGDVSGLADGLAYVGAPRETSAIAAALALNDVEKNERFIEKGYYKKGFHGAPELWRSHECGAISARYHLLARLYRRQELIYPLPNVDIPASHSSALPWAQNVRDDAAVVWGCELLRRIAYAMGPGWNPQAMFDDLMALVEVSENLPLVRFGMAVGGLRERRHLKPAIEVLMAFVEGDHHYLSDAARFVLAQLGIGQESPEQIRAPWACSNGEHLFDLWRLA